MWNREKIDSLIVSVASGVMAVILTCVVVFVTAVLLGY